MTVMDCVARFTELARFVDDYMATDMAKVRRFENGLKLSIRGRIVGLHLRDMDSMVGTALTIERERSRMHGALGMRVLVARGRISLLLVRGRGRRASHEFQDQGQDWASSQLGQRICYFCQQPRHVRLDCT